MPERETEVFVKAVERVKLNRNMALNHSAIKGLVDSESPRNALRYRKCRKTGLFDRLIISPNTLANKTPHFL